MVLSSPIDVDLALTHRLEGALHADGPDVDVGQHHGDEHDTHDPVHHLGQLHTGDVCGVEGKHQQVAGAGGRSAAQHHHPVDHFLAGVEAPGWRVLVADQSAAIPYPPEVDTCGDVPSDPHQEHQ